MYFTCIPSHPTLRQAEKKPKADPEGFFDDVYYDMPANLVEQKQQLFDHVKKYPDHYSMDDH